MLIKHMNIINTLDASASGTATLRKTILSLVSSGAMLIDMLVFPIITQKYNINVVCLQLLYFYLK